jgi:predicted nucleic acid-binding protein
MTLVIDASVVLKWLFADPEQEDQTRQATQLMAAIVNDRIKVTQPTHWLTEVAAVIVREAPDRAGRDVALLEALHLPERMDSAVLQRACALAGELRQPLQNTLYHALAMHTDGTLITADDAYYLKARHQPAIIHLRDWSPEV